MKNRTCYYFDDKIKIADFHFDNILLDEKSYENISVYSISHKILIGTKPLRIKFGKVHYGPKRTVPQNEFTVTFGVLKT